MADTYGFSLNDAKRIGKAVRLVERDEPRLDLSGAKDATLSRGVRMMIGQAGTSAWSIASTRTITIYSGAPDGTGRPTASAFTAVAYNIFADVAASTASRWVAVSNNGWGWYLIAAEC